MAKEQFGADSQKSTPLLIDPKNAPRSAVAESSGTR